MEEDGDCRLRILDRIRRRRRCGMRVGMDVGHARGILGLGYWALKSAREGFLMAERRGACLSKATGR